jgi:hypothetical protein
MYSAKYEASKIDEYNNTGGIIPESHIALWNLKCSMSEARRLILACFTGDFPCQ